eukprot:SM000159S01786  [mRNA]  locus=s159:288661:304957:+ [translate_table: standard]
MDRRRDGGGEAGPSADRTYLKKVGPGHAGRLQGRRSAGKDTVADVRRTGRSRHGPARRSYATKRMRRVQASEDESLESQMGFEYFTEGEPRLGWLLNFSTGSIEDQETRLTRSCMNLYFVCQDGSSFKARVPFLPYFYLRTKSGMEMEVDAHLRRRYEGRFADICIVEREDLDLKNHISGLRSSFLKLSFHSVQDLMEVKREIGPIVERNRSKLEAATAYQTLQQERGRGTDSSRVLEYMDCLLEMREFDVPYHVRFAIDTDVRCGYWYTVSAEQGEIKVKRRADLLQRAEPRICAFDIETTKLPLKFPDATYDQVMMISYMLDGQGYLITNREVVGEDIHDLEYTPKPEFEGPFKVWNEANEEALLKQWFKHMRECKPGIYVTYNGDFFDWPFIEARAAHHGLDMHQAGICLPIDLGFRCDMNQGECRSKAAVHLDCFAWVKRDSYLPQGSQGLKAVTKQKLGYDPLEVNPEDMVRFAIEQPQVMASYSVSDAVATYYLYMTYVHPFIFSLATIIPMPPHEVLRKGSGTLCEMLLMVQAFKGKIICPNKHSSEQEKTYNNHMLDNETYIGGHVECLESGVFRSDLPTRFRLESKAYQELIDHLDRDLHFAIVEESKLEIADVSNYSEVKEAIQKQLEALRDAPTRDEPPVIYHLDVAAMYPNIILTNRLQPPSIVTDEVCAACDFNKPDKTCLRKMEWVWRGETFMATRSEYGHLKHQLEAEQFASANKGGAPRLFRELTKDEQEAKLKDRLKRYCQKVYKRVLDKPFSELRTAGICMRENPFYVDTVKSFRDRRYEYKGLNKIWNNRLRDAKSLGDPLGVSEAQDMVVLYDSLQLAHKCILNSFYGYVMRKGARWYSMEMAGVVTYTGARIIQNARALVERIGKPLELDTDGIWCALPSSFPENFYFNTRSGKKLSISYPCVMLNAEVVVNNSNDQYQTLVDSLRKVYVTSKECSISFEVDGPYKAMILPASKEEGILIKKRYAVFNEDGSLAELKGFEIKRRGELKLIKIFQSEIFQNFLHGQTLTECYAAVGAVANRWLDMLENQGIDVADDELLEYISEANTMSKSLAEYGEKKSCATTTARRLADFLGDAMVKDKGLRCQYIIAKTPTGAPVSERAIPVAIFNTEPEIMRSYVRKWCKMSGDLELRAIVDWDYYRGRLSSSIQKIITIPAAMQKIVNPVPRVVHPNWLWRKVRDKDDKFQQRTIKDLFLPQTSLPAAPARDSEEAPSVSALERDLEDMGLGPSSSQGTGRSLPARAAGKSRQDQKDIERSNHGGGEAANDEGGNGSPEEALLTGRKELMERTNRNLSPEREPDYAVWLEHRKRKWQELRQMKKSAMAEEERRRRREGNASPDKMLQSRARAHEGAGAYFKQKEASLLRSHWQVIQVAPGDRPGKYMAWVLVDHDMYKVPLTIPRQIYMNTRGAGSDDAIGERVNRTLPHGRPTLNLLQVVVAEQQFREATRELAAHLTDPDVEGIYETQVPLEINAVLEIGCVCAITAKARHRSLQEGWLLSELTMKTTTECPYLPSETSSSLLEGLAINYFFIYHSTCDSRGLFAVYSPASASLLVLIQSQTRSQDISVPVLERQFQVAALSSGNVVPPTAIACKVEYMHTSLEARGRIQQVIMELRDTHRGPTVALLECPRLASATHSFTLDARTVPALGDLPCVPALGWQQVAARIAVHRCAASGLYLREHIAMSRYAHVPLGNFEPDWVLFTADVFFARALRDNQQLLWMSNSGLPDLGGVIEEEEASFIDEVEQPELVYPGAYRQVVVELKVHHLAVNALLRSSQIDDMEGGSVFGGQPTDDFDLPLGGSVASHDDSLSCSPAFRVLKQMVMGWVRDATEFHNVFADELLKHAYRWLCSPQSKLHDPALHRVLQKVMKKLFALLLAEMRKLGANIVFADFSRIIIYTGKHTKSAAEGYCQYLLQTLASRELFEFVTLVPQQYWHSLLLMDQYNYGGIPIKLDDEDKGESVGDCIEDNSPSILSNWNIAEYLPLATREYFEVVIGEYIYLPWKHARRKAAEKAAAWDSGNPTATPVAATEMEKDASNYLQTQVTTYFTGKMLRIVHNIQNFVSANKGGDGDDPKAAAAWKFPKLAGSHIELRNPALEFIKSICTVMSIDEAVSYQVMVMRRNLLKLIHVREFAEEAVFRNPCLSFTLPNVICSYCNDCQDLDLCRDPLLLSKQWKCAVPQCGQPYNREWIENALLQIVRQRCRLFQLQDLRCTKCRQVKSAHLADQCRCAGAFECTEAPDAFRQRLKVFANIAAFHGFELLQECVQWLLQTSP